VPTFYDSLLAKLIVYSTDRAEAVARMQRALAQFTVVGVDTTLAFLRFLMAHPSFAAGAVSTNLVESLLRERALG
jgi:acetyl-CoA carboxylase biotin carboxylase subunit